MTINKTVNKTVEYKFDFRFIASGWWNTTDRQKGSSSFASLTSQTAEWATNCHYSNCETVSKCLILVCVIFFSVYVTHDFSKHVISFKWRTQSTYSRKQKCNIQSLAGLQIWGEILMIRKVMHSCCWDEILWLLQEKLEISENAKYTTI